jgi:hypothetical protein
LSLQAATTTRPVPNTIRPHRPQARPFWQQSIEVRDDPFASQVLANNSFKTHRTVSLYELCKD